MKINKNNVTRGLNKIKLLGIKHSPTIFMVAGLAGVVAGTVMACKATRKYDKLKEERDSDIVQMEECVADEKVDYSQEDMDKDVVITNKKYYVDVIKTFAPTVGVMALSFVSIINGHRILNKRNASLVAAYTALDNAYKKYRERVKEAVGEDKESLIFNGVRKIDKDVNGKVTNVERVNNADFEDNPYWRIFDETNPNYDTRDPEANIIFLKSIQRYMNDRLRARGVVFLNEVYEELGMEKTDYGQTVGWLYKKGTGDNYITFDIFKDYNSMFLNGYSKSACTLNFNVDGVVLNKVKVF